MPPLKPMPNVSPPPAQLAAFGPAVVAAWPKTIGGGAAGSGGISRVFDTGVANALGVMLGGIPVLPASGSVFKPSLYPPAADCVEIGEIPIVGGVRKQNFDVVYRPDGARIALDSKSLNSASSWTKNWQNQINDLATEATTLHSRYPDAVAAFLISVPSGALTAPQLDRFAGALLRISGRVEPDQRPYLAEAMCLAVWNTATGVIAPPLAGSAAALHVGNFHVTIERLYSERFGLSLPHV